jgi:hypothetical protein
VLEFRETTGWASCRLAWVTPAMLQAAAAGAAAASAAAAAAAAAGGGAGAGGFGAANATAGADAGAGNGPLLPFSVVPAAIPPEALYSVRGRARIIAGASDDMAIDRRVPRASPSPPSP